MHGLSVRSRVAEIFHVQFQEILYYVCIYKSFHGSFRKAGNCF